MIGLAIGVAVILYLVFAYNGLVKARQMAEEAWSGIDVQLKRRADLIPNLVETVRGYAAHAAGVRSGVAVSDTLVVLRRTERQHVLAVAKAEEARFLAIEIGLDHHLGAGRAKGAGEAFVDCGKGLFEVHRDGHTLAGGKPVRLDDDRRALFANIGPGGLGVGETLIGAGRDSISRAEVFGKTLGTF